LIGSPTYIQAKQCQSEFATNGQGIEILFGCGGDACVAGRRSRILHHAVIDLAKAQADDVEEGKKRDAAISTAPQFRRSS
jgi:hypothetical protein